MTTNECLKGNSFVMLIIFLVLHFFFLFLFKHFLASNDVPPAVSKRVSLSVHCKFTLFIFLPTIKENGMQIIIYAI